MNPGSLLRDWRMEEGPSGARIVIPSPRLWPVAVFLGLWLCGWTAGKVSAIKSLWGMYQRATAWTALFPAGFLVLWLAGWTAGGAAAWGLFLFSWSGREVLSLHEGSLRVRLETVGGLGWSWHFQLPDMAPLALEKTEVSGKNLPPALASMKACHIALDCRGKRWKIGLGMGEERAKELLHTLRSRFGLPTA